VLPRSEVVKVMVVEVAEEEAVMEEMERGAGAQMETRLLLVSTMAMRPPDKRSRPVGKLRPLSPTPKAPNSTKKFPLESNF